jgi:hypothetical protein
MRKLYITGLNFLSLLQSTLQSLNSQFTVSNLKKFAISFIPLRFEIKLDSQRVNNGHYTPVYFEITKLPLNLQRLFFQSIMVFQEFSTPPLGFDKIILRMGEIVNFLKFDTLN